MNRPSFKSIDIWAEWENGILSILTESLANLCDETNTVNDENYITDQLFKIVRHIKYKRNKITFGTIVRQTQNQPVNALGILENESRLRKKPDLQWIFNDENANAPEKSQRCFTIECKCLCTSADGKAYVEEGISRFVLNEWGYSQCEKSGAMVGYIKKNVVSFHLDSVNNNNAKQHYPMLSGTPCDSSSHVYRYEQHFNIREFEPQKFTLHHLWTQIEKYS